MKLRFLALVTTSLLAPAIIANAQALAPCPGESGPTMEAPSRKIAVSILSVKVSSEVDPELPFITDRADIFGTVTVNGHEFHLAKIDGSDSPHWDDTNGRFEVDPGAGPIKIQIDIRDEDGGLHTEDDVIDVSPVVGKRPLSFEFDPCSLRLGGDLSGPSQGVITTSGDEDSGSKAGVITFKVEMADGRPSTDDDVALVEVDLVQVVPRTPALVAGKPTVVMVRMASNAHVEIPAHVVIAITAPDSFFPFVERSFPVEPPLQPGEVRKAYFFVDEPIRFEAAHAGVVKVGATLVPHTGISKDLPEGDCRRTNDQVGNLVSKVPVFAWSVAPTDPPHLKWLKVGTVLDAGSMVPDGQFTEIRRLGSAYINAVFPVVDVPSTFSDVPLPVVGAVSTAYDFLSTLASLIGIPADVLTPFIFLFDLNIVGGLTEVAEDADERLTLMGVLPSSGWFDRFTTETIDYHFWRGVTGLSLGEFMHNGVIFLPRQNAQPDDERPGPALTLPGHELSHTYGLSTDPRLKTNIFCGLDVPILGPLVCAADGGLDEYTNEDATLQNGNPARGFWVSQGGEPAALDPLLDQEQCDSRCLMGPAEQNAHLNWSTRKKWIDASDYERLFDETIILDPLPLAAADKRGVTKTGAANRVTNRVSSPVAYVSGMIDYQDHVFLGPWYRVQQRARLRRVDREVNTPGLYGLRFFDTAGQILQEIGIPLSWQTLEGRTLLPVTVFGIVVPFPAETHVVQVRNRLTDTVLAEQRVSASAPKIRLHTHDRKTGRSVVQGGTLSLVWDASDRDHDRLQYSVLLSEDEVHWSPVAQGLTKHRLRLDTAALHVGQYAARIVASDGVNTTLSDSIRIFVDKPV